MLELVDLHTVSGDLLSGDMLSIGEIAHSTGVSRRMLRHWEQLGLIEPAVVDPVTGYRRYSASQIGRVRAVSELRALGFGLDAIAILLDAELTGDRLVELLREHERTLMAQITEASTRLVQVRTRLDAIEKGKRTIVKNLTFETLPELHLAGVQATVRDETEIPDAVGGLLARLRALLPDQKHETILIYDGTNDDEIIVTAGVNHGDAGRSSDLSVVEVPAVDRGISVQFEQKPSSIADSWIAIDSQLEEQNLRTAGVYRQVLSSNGRVSLQAGIRDFR